MSQKAPRQKIEENGLDKKTLFVRQIPFDATSEELSDFFSQFAPIRHAVVVTDKEKNSRGFGFVSFALDEDAQQGLEKGRKEKFKNRLLRVDIAKRRERNKRTVAQERPENGEELQQTGEADDNDLEGVSEDAEYIFKREIEEKRRSRLIIRNLPWSVRDPNDLKKHFQRYGTVTEAIIPRKKDGKMSGFGFVQMKKFTGAKTAVEKSKNMKISGREVAVDFALEKSKWENIKEKVLPEDKDKEEEEEEEEEQEEETKEEDENKDEDDSDSDDDSDIEKSTQKPDQEVIERPKANKREPYTVFLRNLPYDATTETLKEHFEQFGPVKYALPVTDKETGLARGTGFVAFKNESSYKTCLDNAPDTSNSSASLLLSDDVPAAYVFDGRILSITPAVDRERAGYLKDKNSERRAQILGKEVGHQDKRNLFLLNEGRIAPNSKLAEVLSKADLEIREKSYKLRIDQLNKNPSLHLSLTRLAVRNLPRTMTEKSFKALGRKAVVEFAKEASQEIRQPLSKEEIVRSSKHKQNNSLEDPDSKKSKKKGVVRQAKILVEVSAAGTAGRSKGYGFLEFRDHKSALMALRYLNCHEVTKEEVLEGLTDEEKKFVKFDSANKRRLIVEFAIEHAKVVQRRKEKVKQARDLSTIKRSAREDDKEEGDNKDSNSKEKFKKDKKDSKRSKQSAKKGNQVKGLDLSKKRKAEEPAPTNDDQAVRAMINKRRKKNRK